MLDLVCFATLPPDSNKERQHHLMERFARMGVRVWWIESMGNINHSPIRLLRKVASRFQRGHERASASSDPLDPGIQRVRFFLIPWHGQPLVRQLNRLLLTWQLERLFHRNGVGTKLFWSYYPSDNLVDLQQVYRESPWVYDCVQRLKGSKEVPSYVLDHERAFAQASSIIFTDSVTLLEDNLPLNPRTYQVPQGVDTSFFARAWSSPPPAPAEFAGLPRPVIGYVGGIHHSIDLELIASLAVARPQWSFVLVGPLLRGADALPGLPNIHFLGLRPYHQLPDYLAQFDVALIPYLLNPFTEGVFPTKMLEYLAAGRRVVSTDLPDVRPFASLITIAKTPADFLREIERALADGRDSAEIAGSIQDLTWESRFEQILARLKDLPQLATALKEVP